MPKHWATFGIDLHVEIDAGAGRRTGLEHALRAAIRDGRLAPGARLPSSRALSAEIGLSRGTVSAAYDQLIAEGYLTARRGSGTSVADLTPHRPDTRRTLAPPHPDTPATGHDLAPRHLDTPAAGHASRHPDTRAAGHAGTHAAGHDLAPLRPYTLTTARDVPPHRPATPTSGTNVPPPRYDMRPGVPDVTMFPAAAWLRSTRRVLTTAPAAVHGYGPPGGTAELREALAGYLGRTRGVLADPGQIVVTTGYVQALGLLAGLVGAGDRPVVAMEDPGLAFHREIVRRAGARVAPLPVDARGARTDLLGTAAYEGTGAVVVTPAHQFPTGATLHPERRHALADWARGSGALIIEDDYDGEFRYDRQPVGALQGMAAGHVAYVGTASKTLGPGLRLAWIVLPPHLVGPVVEAKMYADLHTETLAQLVLADMIASHAYDRHVRACRLHYRRRRDLLIARLTGPGRAGDPAGGLSVRGVAAGLHALIGLPEIGPDEATVLRRAQAHGLALDPLGDYWHHPGADQPQGVIVGYGTPSDHTYPAALDTLATALRLPHL
ncbi:GntR family transcriptional regulator [Sphaerisporangium melleum]|uniref:GntR family transcriptional regulator n=1 Tax=Sphaerisporangium melleum TaxID=321316 RepID=A0A917QXK3_9ACTN|nr:PLP-dependent aminotransferase family protein [Sphaerisporangium melleum]GGK73780.1 GntR family transcriptional regulator [Sphaerisporangium melleum]GII70829.1 GntR family transcriptional regulator [Sphaerisporangium melleum]